MTVVAHIPPLRKWILVYELPVGNSSSYGSHYPVHYRLADDPTKFDAAEPIAIVVDDGKGNKIAPNASPYVVWSKEGGKNGTIVVSDADRAAVYINRAGGDPGKWEIKDAGQAEAYSRALHVFEKRQEALAVIGGDSFDGNGWGGLSLTVLDVREWWGGGKGCKARRA